MGEPSSLTAWLAKLESQHPPHLIELGLDRIRTVYERLSVAPNCPVFTVTGTNGKGSTSAMLAEMLKAGGYQVGLYQSPHLLRYNERIRINGREASDSLLCEAFAAVDAVQNVPTPVPLTYFEFGTLAAFWLFSRLKMDVWVLEVGLGGRFDAVNVVDPDVAIITALDVDHINYLGDDRETIALEKAGIARRGRPLICGDPNPPAALRTMLEQQGVIPYYFGQDFGEKHARPDAETWEFWRRSANAWFWHSDSDFPEEPPTIQTWQRPALPGAHQYGNAAMALMALQCLEPRLLVDIAAKQKGLSEVSLPGRLQTISHDPLTICDVAHNPHAAQALRRYLDEQPVRPTLAVFAMLSDKDIKGVIAAVNDIIDGWYLAPLPGPRGADVVTLRKALADNQVGAEKIHEFSNVADAYRSAAAHNAVRIIVFGSFLTVAEVLRSSTLELIHG